MVSQEPKEKWELKETLETWVLQGCAVRTVLRAPKGRVVPWVNLDPQASLEKRESWVFQVCQVTQDVRA